MQNLADLQLEHCPMPNYPSSNCVITPIHFQWRVSWVTLSWQFSIMLAANSRLGGWFGEPV